MIASILNKNNFSTVGGAVEYTDYTTEEKKDFPNRCPADQSVGVIEYTDCTTEEKKTSPTGVPPTSRLGL